MICKFCGNQIDDNSDFCFICGQKVEQNNDRNSAPETAAVDNYSVQNEAVAVMPETPFIFEEPLPDTAKASKLVRVISFIFAIIGLIIYAKKKKDGKTFIAAPEQFTNVPSERREKLFRHFSTTNVRSITKTKNVQAVSLAFSIVFLFVRLMAKTKSMKSPPGIAV